MKQWKGLVLCVVLVMVLLPWTVLAAGAPSEKTVIEVVAVERLATRSGPATDFRDTGVYEMEGETVKLLSRALDEYDVTWVQCEVSYRGELRRVYTGAKRFDVETYDLVTLPEEEGEVLMARVIAASKAKYGPGEGYATYEKLTVDEGQIVQVIRTEEGAVENGYVQVELGTYARRYRAWVQEDTLRVIAE